MDGKWIRVDLSTIFLSNLDLSRADLRGANLSNANLSNVDLSGKYIGTVYLGGTIFDEEQIKYLEQKYSLQGTRVSIEKTNEIISL